MTPSVPQKTHRLHFVGIGGIGMSGIAEVFLRRGQVVSGSDLASGESVERLRSLGARIELGHQAQNVGDADVVVISSAVKADNPELLEARKRRIPVIRRAEMLAELMRGKTGVAVAGTHGKTTTTSMLATILSHAGLDPTLVIGGKVDALGGNAKLGLGDLVVAEADESDGSFLHLPATYTIVTNIDDDHLDHYGSLARIEEAFSNFTGQIPFYGMNLLCGEDPGVAKILPTIQKPFRTYGFENSISPWDFEAVSVEITASGSRYQLRDRVRKKILGELQVHVPGRHNVLNSLGAAALALTLDVPFEKVAQGLAEYRGVRRRFEFRYKNEKTKQAIVDDYGHHPTEVLATLAAARQYWGAGRILAVFQPHRYSRTQQCMHGFQGAFREADALWLTEIYAASETPIEGVSGEGLAKSIAAITGREVGFAPTLNEVAQLVAQAFQPGDLVLCLGAGSITQLPDLITEKLREAKGQ